MTTTDAAAMTEASGLPEDTARIEHASDAIRDMTRDMEENPIPLAPDAGPALRLSDRLRQVTREAPLHSLAIAFLLGALVARRRR
jgi:hypothetical protein